MPALAEMPKARKIRLLPLLPYLAVLQADLHQTIRSWLYRMWVMLSITMALGYLLYRLGAYQEAGIVQSASQLTTDIVRWVIFGSVTLIIVLTAGCISSERGTLADSVLSRGISRHQYFLGKWHSRLISILGTFLLLSGLVLAACFFLLRDDRISVSGAGVALLHVAALLAVVITCGVTVSAIANSTLLGVALVWMLLYGVGFLLSFLPPSFPSPDRALAQLPQVLHGFYDSRGTVHLLGWSVGLSLLMAVLGMICFSRKDV